MGLPSPSWVAARKSSTPLFQPSLPEGFRSVYFFFSSLYLASQKIRLSFIWCLLWCFNFVSCWKLIWCLCQDELRWVNWIMYIRGYGLRRRGILIVLFHSFIWVSLLCLVAQKITSLFLFIFLFWFDVHITQHQYGVCFKCHVKSPNWSTKFIWIISLDNLLHI